MANAYTDALLNALRLGRDVGVGAVENALTLGSGIVTEPFAGLTGLAAGATDLLQGRGFERAGESAREVIEDVRERGTYAPRSDVGQRGLENIGTAMEQASRPVSTYAIEPIAAHSPALAAGLVAAADVVGPKGKPKGAPKPKPRFDPGSPQQLIPGIEPLSLDQAAAQAQGAYAQALRDMTFEDMNRGLRFEYDPDWTGAALGSSQLQPGAWNPDFIEPRAASTVGKRQVNQIRGSRIFRRDLEDANSPRTVPDAMDSMIHENSGLAQHEVGEENFQQMMARAEALRAAEREAMARGEEAAITQARVMNERIRRGRAELAEPGISPQQRIMVNEQMLNALRNRPVEVSNERVRMMVPTPGEGLMSPVEWRDLLGHSTLPPEDVTRQISDKARIVRQLRGEPEPTPPYRMNPSRQPSERRASLPEVEGRDPNQMNREAVDAFLTEAQNVEPLFQYGLMPPRSVRSLEDFAEHFGEQAGKRIDVDWSYADSDEPSKIKVEKEHGRGEVMRDRYGDYKYETADPGDKLRDEYGDVKKKEVELVGPPEEGEDILLGYKPKRAQGGEFNYDEEGNPIYRKSEGGEPVRDERGRVKEEWRDNPDYRGSDIDEAELSVPREGSISIQYGDPAYMTATSAGKSGQLLYQTALAHASREGIDIDTGSLTDINQYRLLANVLSNIARSGENPRSVTGTSSGLASRARGRAQGPEVWRAEAEEARARLLRSGVEPDRVRFDPERGFSIDGKPASPDDIKVNINELSPLAGRQSGSSGGVGQKSLMRNAVFQWLRNATPEDAQRVAAKWPKEWGPLFAGISALAVLGNEEEEATPITAD